jgi:hypothetical protein
MTSSTRPGKNVGRGSQNNTNIVMAALVEPRPWVLAACSNIADDPVSAEWAGDEWEEQSRGDGGRRRCGGRHGRGDGMCFGGLFEDLLVNLG